MITDSVTKKARVARLRLDPSQLEPFGNSAIVAGAKQAAVSLMSKKGYDPWVETLPEPLQKHLKNHPGNIQAG